jgi:CheY-like chemotaxis protein
MDAAPYDCGIGRIIRLLGAKQQRRKRQHASTYGIHLPTHTLPVDVDAVYPECSNTLSTGVWAVEVSPEERSVAKILVADDNSNIQKMVGLALKDHGIDVVAVGNGEAAVRKISDVKPDLVLADVFMPVRNGYEVCRYVKEDSTLAHIPVILLVGAFDPLDEQEAQRVGADGVLKKPFVPPDPLISMVKSALVRANSAHPVAATEKPAPAAAIVGTPATPPVAPPVAPTVVMPPAETAAASTDAFIDDIPPKPETLNIESSGKPLAFGSLLETPTAPEDDASFVSAGAGPERDWGKEEEFEEEGEDEESASWRRDGGSQEFAEEPEVAAEKPKERAKRKEAWTPTREKTQDLIEAAVEPDLPPLPPIPVRPKSVPPPSTAQDTWAAPRKAEPEFVQQKTTTPIAPLPEVVKEPEPTFVSETTAPAPPVSAPAVTPAPANGGDSWFSTSSSPWDASAKTGPAAPVWEVPSTPGTLESSTAPEERPLEMAPVEANASVDGSLPEDFISEEASTEPVSYVSDPALVRNVVVASNPLPDLISDGSISPETVDTIREETTSALDTVPEPVIETAKESATKAPEQSAPEMDALVARVLAKMSPEMLQAVTREILKPVVEAMIRDEIGAKKS